MNINDYKKMNKEEQEALIENLGNKKEEVDEALVKAFGPDAQPREIKEYPELDVKASKAEMVIFGVNGEYFKSSDEANDYIKRENIKDAKLNILEYIRTYAGRSDVIHKTYDDGMEVYLCAVDEDGYGIYNRERSNREGEFSWEFSEGSIAETYAVFRDAGITFENDIYAKIADDKRRFEELCKAGNYFNAREDNEHMTPEEKRYLFSMVEYAKKFPDDLASQFETDDLVQGIEYVDQILTNGLVEYRKLVKREKDSNNSKAEYAHIQELKKLIAHELETYFGIAENFETALRRRDYIYGYQTYMPDVSQIIYDQQKMLEKLQ